MAKRKKSMPSVGTKKALDPQPLPLSDAPSGLVDEFLGDNSNAQAWGGGPKKRGRGKPRTVTREGGGVKKLTVTADLADHMELVQVAALWHAAYPKGSAMSKPGFYRAMGRAIIPLLRDMPPQASEEHLERTLRAALAGVSFGQGEEGQ